MLVESLSDGHGDPKAIGRYLSPLAGLRSVLDRMMSGARGLLGVVPDRYIGPCHEQRDVTDWRDSWLDFRL